MKGYTGLRSKKQQDINSNDIQAVVDTLESNYLTQGPTVEKFEEGVASYCNVQYAIAVNSATSALHIACLALGLKKGGLLWTSPNTFVASANCALYCDADVDFVDIDPTTHNMCPEKLSEKLKQAKKCNRLPDVVVPVHFSGASCDMSKIYALSKEYGFKVIEDASHAIGGVYKGHKVGSCQFSDITVFSFHPVKIITSGEGGMLLTNNSDVASKAALLRSHGITRDSDKMKSPSHGPWYYQQVELGFNYRMNELSGALGLSQLQRIDEFIARRTELAARYSSALRELPVILPSVPDDVVSSWHLYPVRIILDEVSMSRREIFEHLWGSGVAVNVHYIPVHTQPYYLSLGFQPGMFPESESYYDGAISLPIYYALSNKQQDLIIQSIYSVFSSCKELVIC